jgi:hypothetical protein
MTARRLRRKNKSDVKRFLYVPLPIATVSFVGSEKTRVAIKRRDWPCFAADHRNVATHRILSQNVVIGRKLAVRHKARKIAVPTPPRHFLICRGPFSGFERIASKRFCPEGAPPFPYKVWGTFPDPPVSKHGGRKIAGNTNFLVRKTLCHSLICREEVCALVRLFARRSKNLIRQKNSWVIVGSGSLASE